MPRPVRRLGIYVDGPYRLVATPSGSRVAPDPADFPFMTFACTAGAAFESTVVFGRAQPAAFEEGMLLLPSGVAMAPLPSYDTLGRLGQVARAVAGTVRGFWRGLADVDAVWVFGPHPFAILLAALARIRGRRVVLGVRQDTVAYFRGRLPGARWRPALALVRVLDASFRAMARALPVTVVGDEIAGRYGGPRAGLLTMTVSLVEGADVASSVADHDWNGEIRLATVGRVDVEKNPFLLVDAIAELERRHPGRYRLRWAGTGPLAGEVERRARELGIGDRFELAGFVPFGPKMLEHYRSSHAFVHVSLTEGVPAVIVEALASGIPVVATGVGGVPGALEHGRAGLLVPPRDRDALVDAIVRLTEDGGLRRRVAERGLELARTLTRDAQAARVAAFIRDPDA